MDLGQAKLGNIDTEGRTPAWHACASGSVHALDALRSRAPGGGAKWATRADGAGVSPMTAACGAGSLEVCKFLVERVGLRVEKSHVEAVSGDGPGTGLRAWLEGKME